MDNGEQNKYQDKSQEFFLLLSDSLSRSGRIWAYGLGGVIILAIPLFFILRPVFTELFLAGYQPPEITYHPSVKEPLQVIEKKIFRLSDDSYSGYVRIRNINLEWGVPLQPYTAEFKTFGGTVINKVDAKTFILPSSDKILVFPRFRTDKKPDELIVVLGESKFNQKPAFIPSVSMEVQRMNFGNAGAEFRLTAAVKNTSGFGVRRVGLPAILYNNKNEVIGVNYTQVNELLLGETRSFEYFWPQNMPAARAEIITEANIFDRNLLMTEEDKPIFDDLRNGDDGY